MKLEIKHLENYLSHKLMCVRNGSNPVELVGLRFGNEAVNNELWIWKEGKQYLAGYLYECKPILRPLSDFADINSDAMNSLNCDMSEQINLNEFAIGYICLGSLYQSTYDLCLKNHIDVFGLIDKGLALPLINQGCYKENELIRVVRTDKIENLINDGQYQEIAIEVK